MSNIVDEVNQELAKNMKEFLPRLLRLIRTVQQIQEFYERRKDNKLKDNFEELQKSTFKLMKEYEALYNKIYQEKDYQALLPTSFEKMQKIQISKDMEVITQNDDFKQLCEHYYNENYDDDFERAYMKEDNFNYNDFCDETDFEEDIKESIFKEVEQQHEIKEINKMSENELYEHIKSEFVNSMQNGTYNEKEDNIFKMIEVLQNKSKQHEKSTPAAWDDFER